MSLSFRIAISGGGLAGGTLLRGVLNYPQLDVHIFESAESFKYAILVLWLRVTPNEGTRVVIADSNKIR